MVPLAINIGFQYAYDDFFCLQEEIDMKKEIEEMIIKCKKIEREAQINQKDFEWVLNELKNEKFREDS